MLDKHVNSTKLFWYTYCLNNPLKYTDPSGMLMKARDESDYAFVAYFGWMTNVAGSWHYSDFGGGGGGGGYHYDWKNEVYRNNIGEIATWNEVYFNYVVPFSYSVNDPGQFIKDFQKAYTSAFFGINDYDKMLIAGPGGTEGDKHPRPNGNAISFSFDFAFAGGFGFEIGRVVDSYGSKKWFISGNVNIGYGLSAGFNYKEIYNANGYSFNVNNYQGNAGGFSWGALIFGGETTGDKPSFEFDGFDKWGYKYIQESSSISILSAPKVGAWWTNSSTKFIWP